MLDPLGTIGRLPIAQAPQWIAATGLYWPAPVRAGSHGSAHSVCQVQAAAAWAHVAHVRTGKGPGGFALVPALPAPMDTVPGEVEPAGIERPAAPTAQIHQLRGTSASWGV